MLELLAAADPPSLLAWAILAVAAGMYPVGLMFGAPCRCCDCNYRVQIKASGFAGGAAWSIFNGVTPTAEPPTKIFFGSWSQELGSMAPGFSPDPIDLGGGLELVSDEDYVSLTYTQSPGHVLRLSFDGTNTLGTSDDPVTLEEVDENTLEADADWMENDFIETVGTWDVRIAKPGSLCDCKCYCGQDVTPADIESAPAAYTLQFSDDFVTEEGAFYAPGGPLATFVPATETDPCPMAMERWSEPFSLRKLSKEDSGGELLYQSDPIPFGKCTSRSYLFRPCLDGAAALQISGGSKTAFAPNAALPGYKPSEYYDEPETYTDDLFGGAIEFGFATLTPAEEHTPDGAAGCGVGTDGVSLAAFPGCGGDCPPSELTVEIEEQCQKLSYYDPYSQTMKEADCFNPTNFEGGSYTVTLVPEESQGCRLVYRYETDKYTSCADNQEHAELSITVVVDNSMPGEAACGCEGGRIEVAISGLTVRGTRSSIYTDDYMDMKITNAHGKPWVLVQVLSNGVSNGLRPLPDCHVVCGGFSAEREAAAGGVGRMLFRSDSPGTGNTPCDYAIDYESTGRPPYFSKITVSG